MSHTLGKSLSFVEKHHASSNENQLAIFDHLLVLQQGEFWKFEVYYKDAPKLKNLRGGSFSNFVRSAFGITIHWFNSVRNILTLENGRDMFIAYGRSNMVTYVNSTPKERKAIIKEAKWRAKTISFARIRADLFPKRGTKKQYVISIWEVKYRNLKKRFDRFKILKQEQVNELKQTIHILSHHEDKARAKKR
jgi:hypothetical protein